MRSTKGFTPADIAARDGNELFLNAVRVVTATTHVTPVAAVGAGAGIAVAGTKGAKAAVDLEIELIKSGEKDAVGSSAAGVGGGARVVPEIGGEVAAETETVAAA